MIYLIGGAPRVGKTMLARLLMERNKIAYIPADILTHALDHAYPQLGIRPKKDGWDKIPDLFYPYLREFVKSCTLSIESYTIEGDSFFPEHVQKLSKEFELKSCFLGASNINIKDIRLYSGQDDWVKDLPEEDQQKLPTWIIEKSAMFKKESGKNDIQYFDMGIDREKTLEAAYNFLVR